MINILFLHKNDSWYLPYSLRQCVTSNPSARVILLGDESNRKYNGIVEHHCISNYFQRADAFSKLYINYSTWPGDYELFCMQRWFIWLEFMEKFNIEEALLPDTDVLIMQDVEKYLNEIPRPFAFTKGTSNYMGFMFISRSELSSICDFFVRQYKEETKTGKLKSMYDEYLLSAKEGGISDITLFAMYENQCAKLPVINTELTPLNDSVFVHSMQSPLFKHDIKHFVKIWQKDGLFYVKSGGKYYSVVGMHCYGEQKILIRKYFSGGGNLLKDRMLYYWKTSYVHKLIANIRKLIYR